MINKYMLNRLIKIYVLYVIRHKIFRKW